MDKMSIINMLVVGIPETILSIIFMLVVLRGKIMGEDRALKFIIKQVLSIILVLSCFYFVRKNINGLILIAFLNTIVYTISMKFIWKFNIRQSILSGSLAMFLIIFSEILTVAPTTTFVVENILKYDFLDAKIIWSLPTRIIQILTTIVIYKKKLYMKNNTILVTDWSVFSISQKITTFILISLIMTSIVFSMNYSEFYMKMKLNNIDVAIFNTSMFLLLIQSVIYLLIALVLLNRTSKYEDYKNILNRDADEIMSVLNTIKNN